MHQFEEFTASVQAVPNPVFMSSALSPAGVLLSQGNARSKGCSYIDHVIIAVEQRILV